MNLFNENKKIVVRMAPSPTGNLHIGTARTALYNYIFAQKYGGTFIMRIEDTDKERSTSAFEEEIIEGLTWLGLKWDDFYRQSERGDIYKKYLETLIAEEKAYVSKEESRREPGTEIEVIRLKNAGKSITFEDEVRGEVTFDTTELGDFVIARSIDDALYHFTVVVDDHEMGVTHVIRGEDHISNTPRQILIQEAIGAVRPVYAHLPLLLAPDRSKLSKRHGAVALKDYQDAGYLPSALGNYLSLLGWNPGTDQELFSLEELTAEFDLGGVQKGGAIFDIEKLKWFNKEHLRGFDAAAFYEYAAPWLLPIVSEKSQFSEDRLQKLLPTIHERITHGSEIVENAEAGEYDFAFETPAVTAEMLAWKNDDSAKDALPRLRKVAEILSTLPEDGDFETLKAPIFAFAEQVGKGEVLWPLRVALTGKERSPDPFTVIHIIGTAESYKRVQHACDTILSA
ncbi:glutamate--tRNA ligase [Candidatus Parcubacteria bacterium]|nr:glutamate--tRNA ligase [Candidatus Parcubacteria bacterium]